MTGFSKTYQIVTLGLFHFMGWANGYTCRLHIHSAITRLSWLAFFSRSSFANLVNSWLRQCDAWRVLHGRRGSEIHPSDQSHMATMLHFYCAFITFSISAHKNYIFLWALILKVILPCKILWASHARLPSDRETSLMPSKHVWAYDWHFLNS